MGGVHQLSEAGEDQNGKHRYENRHACYLPGENAVSIDHLPQRKKCFCGGHANETGVTTNDNVTCMLKKESPCTLDAFHVLLRKNPEFLQPKINSHIILPVLKLPKFLKGLQENTSISTSHLSRNIHTPHK